MSDNGLGGWIPPPPLIGDRVNRNQIFQIAIRLGIKRIRIIRYSYPFQKKPELNIQPDNSFKTDIT